MTLKRTFVLTAAAFMATAGSAFAVVDTYRSSNTGGSWTNSSSWIKDGGGSGIPDSDDIAIIQTNVTITVDSNGAVAGDLTINASGGKVVVDDTYDLAIDSGSLTNGGFELNGGRLIINNNSGWFAVPAGKTFVMKGNSPVLDIRLPDGFRLSTGTSKLEIQTSATIQAQNSGSLRGDDSNADVVINVSGDDDVTLTLASGASMHGGMLIQRDGAGDGLANFVNAGVVQADSSRTITLGDLLDSITDSGSSCDVHWRAESGPSTLSFEVSAPSLVTSFAVNGTVACNGNTVATTGVKSGSGTHSCVSASGSCP